MTLQQQIRANRWRTLWLLLLFALLVGVLGAILAYAFQPSLLIVVGVIGIVYGIFSWLSAGSIIASATSARPADRAQYPRLFHVVETVAIAAGLPQPPPIYVVDDPAPNAFAAGRSPEKAYVCVTTGLLNLMDERELEGVIAHEISHVRNHDVRLMSLVAVLVGVVALLSDFLLRISFFGGGRRSGGSAGLIAFALGLAALIIAPIAAVLIQLSVSRRREYLADVSAVEITGDAEGLALALRKPREPVERLVGARVAREDGLISRLRLGIAPREVVHIRGRHVRCLVGSGSRRREHQCAERDDQRNEESKGGSHEDSDCSRRLLATSNATIRTTEKWIRFGL